MLLTFLRVLKFAVQDFWRNFWLSIVTISVLVLALLSINILFSLRAISANIITVVEDKVDINIMVKNTATPAELNNFQTFLTGLEEVSSVKLMTKAEVLESFKEKNSGNKDIEGALTELEDNPFNDTLVVKAKSTQDYELLITKVNSSTFGQLIENNDFSDPQKITSFVRDASAKAENFGIVLAGLFALISFLIVFNTIRMAIYTHKEEIGVMRLVGATNWFIRGPYIVEGILLGITAMIIKVVLLYFVLNLTQPVLRSFLGVYSIDLIAYFNQHFWSIFGLELLAVVVLTMISSAIAMRRYLRV